MQPNNSGRLVIVSNRLPFQLKKAGHRMVARESDGGLVSALKSYFDNPLNKIAFNSTVWIGSAEFTEQQWHSYKSYKTHDLQYQIEPLFIDKKLYSKYYNGFCNATLWPMCHYFPSFVEFDSDTFQSYKEVNQMFAEKIISTLQPGDVVWVHDYQLMLVPGKVRVQKSDVTIGFFLHIPFPSFEVFRMLHTAWKNEIVQGLLGSDLIGFHTHEYAQHFLKTVQMIGGFDYQFRRITLPDRIVKVEMFPLGIDFEKFHKCAEDVSVRVHIESIKNNFACKKIIFSVDRLDYTKGITHRLLGFERFLEHCPEWRERVVFIQIVVPSRQIVSKYTERKRMIEEEIGRINGKYSTMAWQPIIYRYSQLPFEELVAMYGAADVALVTPLRDGMNLVAKEFVACKAHDGVLILSELAGAANEMAEAILVNPLDVDEVGRAIHTALEMPEENQKRDIQALHKRLSSYTVVEWMNDFISQLSEIKLIQVAQETRLVSHAVGKRMLDEYSRANKRLLLLDYDGTLVSYSKHPAMANPGENLLALLKNLCDDECNDVVIISGRDRESLEQWLGALPLTLIAEHGTSVRHKGGKWEDLSVESAEWKLMIQPILDLYVKRSPGAFVEEKRNTLVWHYRNVNPELGFIRSRELLDNLHHMIRNTSLQILDGNKVVEVKLAGVDKGSATRRIMGQSPYDFIIAIGDDKTDEDMFRALSDHGYSIKIGRENTVAQYYVPSQGEAIKLLNLFLQERVDV
jgi:trehalose 6-phosphate synthase/phosphatase